jgi:hypothetical protein
MRSQIFSRLDPRLLAGCALLAGVAAAPWISHRFDLQLCFLGWARATAGSRPWEMYDARPRGFAPVDCDYPPLIPYLLTLAERLRLAVGAPERGGVAVLLVKLPSLLAWAAAIPLSARVLRDAVGDEEARTAAALCALCLPVFVNAAIWGQFDGMIAVFLFLATALLLSGRLLAAGAVLGLALATKLMVVAMFPVAAVWTLRRFGIRRLVPPLLAGAQVVAAMAAPLVARGYGAPVLAAYTKAVDYYPRRTMEAYNVWYLLDRIESRSGALTPAEVRLDTRPVAGPFTSRDIGLVALTLYLGYLCLGVWRRPTSRMLVLGAAMSLFAFFMLPTQIHGRYLVAAVPLLAATAVRSRSARLLLLGLAVTATLGQCVELWRSMLEHGYRLDPEAFADIRRDRRLVREAAVALCFANLFLFGWGTVAFGKETGEE